MKKIYLILDKMGFEEYEVADNVPVFMPFTEIKPLEIENMQSQYFNFTENRWKEAITQSYADELELSQKLLEALQTENATLKAKTEQMAQLNAKLMLNDVAINKEIETIKTQIGGAQ